MMSSLALLADGLMSGGTGGWWRMLADGWGTEVTICVLFGRGTTYRLSWYEGVRNWGLGVQNGQAFKCEEKRLSVGCVVLSLFLDSLLVDIVGCHHRRSFGGTLKALNKGSELHVRIDL